MAKTKVVAILRADGSRIDFGIPEEMALEEMQKLVGGYIEMVKTKMRHQSLIVNEEGSLRGLPPNQQATQLVHPMVMTGPRGIQGDALLVRS